MILWHLYASVKMKLKGWKKLCQSNKKEFDKKNWKIHISYPKGTKSLILQNKKDNSITAIVFLVEFTNLLH